MVAVFRGGSSQYCIHYFLIFFRGGDVLSGEGNIYADILLIFAKLAGFDGDWVVHSTLS